MKKSIYSSAVVLLLCQCVHAQLYLEDGFNYTSGNPLAGSGSWASTGGGNTANMTIGSGSLSYNGLSDTSPSGNQAALVGTASTVNAYVPLGSPVTGTVYMSFLAQCTAIPGTTGYYLAGLLPSTTTTAGGRTTDPLALYVKGPSAGQYQIGIGTFGGGSTVYDPSATGLSPGSTVNLIVVSYNLITELASMWFNPTSLGGAAPAADITDQGVGATFANIDSAYLKDLNTYGTWNIDDLRIGGTWADVTPTPAPEPSTLVLAALGGLSLLSFRRRN